MVHVLYMHIYSIQYTYTYIQYVYICIHLSNYRWMSAPSFCGQGVSDEAYLHRRGCHSNSIDQKDQSKGLPMNLRQPRHYLRFIAFVRLFSTSHALGGQDAFFGAICAGFVGSGFVDVVPDVFPRSFRPTRTHLQRREQNSRTAPRPSCSRASSQCGAWCTPTTHLGSSPAAESTWHK